MQCRDIQQLLPVRRELSWTQEQTVQAHLRDCAACGAAARQVDRTQSTLRALAAGGALSSGPPERVSAAIRARLAVPASRSGRLPARRLVLTGTLLALVLLATVLGRDTLMARVRTLGLGFNTPPPPMQLYMPNPSGEIVPVDPQTLEEIQGGAPLTLDIPAVLKRTYPLLSADYSTLAVIGVDPTAQPDSGRTVWMLDARTRAVRNEFQLSEKLQAHQLSGDGTRLAALHCEQQQMAVTCEAWHVFDTSNGQRLGMIPHEQPFYRAWLDQTGSRLYTLRMPCEQICDAPGAPTLLSYDTATSALVGQLELRDVIAGFWKAGSSAEIGLMSPGLALSPDGRQFAILHADVPVLTLVDTATMTVISTRPLNGKTAWPDQGVLHPEGEGGFELHMGFSADGRSLYVIGAEHGVDAAGEEAEQRTGLRLINVERAEVISDLLVGQWVGVAGELPDGSALYVRAREIKTSRSSSLYRVDPLTLAITAERSDLSSSQGGLLMLPALTQPQP